MNAALSSVLTDAVELDGLLKSNPALAITSRKKRNRTGTSRPEVNWNRTGSFLDATEVWFQKPTSDGIGISSSRW